MLRITCLSAVTCLAVIPLYGRAHAAPADFSGVYDLSCEQVNFTLHADIGGVVSGQSAHYGGTLTLTVPTCDPSDPQIGMLAEQVRDECVAASLPEWYCDDLETSVVVALEGTAELVPYELETTVKKTWDPLHQLLGIFPMHGVHQFVDGVRGWDYVLDTNPGGNNGRFVAGAIGITGSGANDVVGCVSTVIGAVDGRIDPNDGYSLSADFGVDASLTCAATSGMDWVTGVIGITFHGAVSGAKQ